MRIDHIVFAVRDIDAAAREFGDRYGLEAQARAELEGSGTANRIVPVGNDQFIELLGISDAKSRHPIVRFLSAQLVQGDRLLQLAIDPGDIDSVSARLGEPVPEVVRTNEGRRTRFRLTGVAGGFGPQLLPFFVVCAEGREWRMGYAPARHRVRAEGIRWVELGSDEALVRAQLAGAELPLRFAPGRPGVSALALALDGEEVVLRS